LINFDDIEGGFVAQPSASVVSVELDGEAVLLHESDETLHLLSPTATIVWNLLDGRSPLDEIAADLAEAFNVALNQMEHDVVGVVKDFGARGLLQGVIGDESLKAENTLAPLTDRTVDE
jgi:hypothetical protein